MRVFIKAPLRNAYFLKIKQVSNLTWTQISKELKVPGRMLRTWRTGKFTLPLDVSIRIANKFGVKLPDHKLLNPYWNNKLAAKKGGLRRYVIYGNFGTTEGRRRGGLNSLISNRLRRTKFQFQKTIRTPKDSPEVAELIGIMIGDGGITNLQIRVTLNKRDDKEYLTHVCSLFRKLFGVTPSVFHRKSTSEILISRKALVNYFVGRGLPLGNKIAQEIDIPGWIKADQNLATACLRGIFDTDGSVYLDKHPKGDYSSINLAITSASGKLLFSIYEILASISIAPTISSKRSVRVRKGQQIILFFDKIGSRNPKHIKKYFNFLRMERYPSGRKGAVSKTAWA